MTVGSHGGTRTHKRRSIHRLAGWLLTFSVALGAPAISDVSAADQPISQSKWRDSHMTFDSTSYHDWIGLGRTGTWAFPYANVDGYGRLDDYVYVVARKRDEWGEWMSVRIEPPKGQQLRAGRRYDALRFPTSEDGGLNVSAGTPATNGRACNESTGEFTINEVTVDAEGLVSSVDIDVVQHCESSTIPPTVVHVVWNRTTNVELIGSDQVQDESGLPVLYDIAVSDDGTRTATGNVIIRNGDTDIAHLPLDDTGRARVALSLPVGSHVLTAHYSGDRLHPPGVSRPITPTIRVGNASSLLTVTAPDGSTFAPDDISRMRFVGFGPFAKMYGTDSRRTLFEVRLVAPFSERLAAGTYHDNERYNLHSLPSLSLWVSDPAANTSCINQGEFTVHSIGADPVGNISSLDAHFTAWCHYPPHSNIHTGAVQYRVPPLGETRVELDASDIRLQPGDEVQLAATVTTATGNSLGHVRLMDGANELLRTRPDTDGRVETITTALEPGTHWITAVYEGDEHHTAVTSAPVVVHVDKTPSETELTILNTVIAGVPTPFVVEAGTATGPITGTVQVHVDDRRVATVPVKDGYGVGTITLQPGRHVVDATLVPTDVLAPSTSARVAVLGRGL